MRTNSKLKKNKKTKTTGLLKKKQSRSEATVTRRRHSASSLILMVTNVPVGSSLEYSLIPEGDGLYLALAVEIPGGNKTFLYNRLPTDINVLV